VEAQYNYTYFVIRVLLWRQCGMKSVYTPFLYTENAPIEKITLILDLDVSGFTALQALSLSGRVVYNFATLVTDFTCSI
jgi:hypothetical protein